MFNFFKPMRGDELLKIEKSRENFDLSYVFGEARKHGVTDDDIRAWWNMPDKQHEELMQENDAIRNAAYNQWIDEGFSKEEAISKIRKGFPVYDVYEPGLSYYEDSNLPYELLPRVNNFINSLTPEELLHFKEESGKASSVNAFIRHLIKKGNL